MARAESEAMGDTARRERAERASIVGRRGRGGRGNEVMRAVGGRNARAQAARRSDSEPVRASHRPTVASLRGIKSRG